MLFQLDGQRRRPLSLSIPGKRTLTGVMGRDQPPAAGARYPQVQQHIAAHLRWLGTAAPYATGA